MEEESGGKNSLILNLRTRMGKLILNLLLCLSKGIRILTLGIRLRTAECRSAYVLKHQAIHIGKYYK